MTSAASTEHPALITPAAAPDPLNEEMAQLEQQATALQKQASSLKDQINALTQMRRVCQLGKAARCHAMARGRGAWRAVRAIVSRSRSRVAIRAPTALGFAAALRATSARSQRR